MFLILEPNKTKFGLRLKSVSEQKGLETLHLNAEEIISSLLVRFYQAENHSRVYLLYKDRELTSDNIRGVYCGLDGFEPGSWDFFSEVDAEYAAREFQALWLCLLASLEGRVINPPALDTLAGTALSVPEKFRLAQTVGLEIPMLITVESGLAASELAAAGINASFTDLGEVWANETRMKPDDLMVSTRRNNHIRIREYVPGRQIYLTLAGERFFPLSLDQNGQAITMSQNEIPEKLCDTLRVFSKRLNLNLAEYSFSVTPSDEFIFNNVERMPKMTLKAFGDELLSHLIDCVIREES